MHINVFGNGGYGGYSAHGEYEPTVDRELSECPFCHERDIEVSNSHTPYYHASCNTCGAVGPDHIEDFSVEWDSTMSKEAVVALHKRAFEAAIDAWNDRERSQ